MWTDLFLEFFNNTVYFIICFRFLFIYDQILYIHHDIMFITIGSTHFTSIFCLLGDLFIRILYWPCKVSSFWDLLVIRILFSELKWKPVPFTFNYVLVSWTKMNSETVFTILTIFKFYRPGLLIYPFVRNSLHSHS